MPRGERAARVERAKSLGRIAHRLARGGKIFGNVKVEGEEKRVLEYTRGHLSIELWYPWRSSAFETEFSRLRVTYGRTKVLELRWDRADHFNVVLFKPGEWERVLER